MIEITDTHNVMVDGKNIGHIIDAVRSNPPRADPVEMKAAFDTWFVNHANACRDAIAEAKVEIPNLREKHHQACIESDDKHAAAIAALNEAHAADIAALRSEHAAHCAALEADIATLGTKEEAQVIRRAQERTRKLEQLAALTAELRADEPEPVDLKP